MDHPRTRRRGLVAMIAWLLLAVIASLTPPPSRAGEIAIIIDDIGYSQHWGEAAIHLDPDISISILPDTPYGAELAEEANRNGNEIMLHLPMQALTRTPPGEPDELTLNMSEEAFKNRIRDELAEYPAVVGVNNHMGSLLTQRQRPMDWLMDVLAEFPALFFIDSRTHHKTVAALTAARYAIPHASRDVFLDPDADKNETLNGQLARLLQIVGQQGVALAIGHPHPATIRALKRFIPRLRAAGHELVPVSRYVTLKEEQTCPECSSPLLRVVKNSKPSPLSTCCDAPKSKSSPPD